MATPQLTHHTLSGTLGPILVDVRTASPAAAQPAVLLLHGFKGFKDYSFLPPMAERLARAGYAAVTISVSGSGVDEHGNFVHLDRFARNTYTRELGDVEIAVRAIRAGELAFEVPTSLGVVGHSRGGGVALCVSREARGIDAIVTWAAISTIRRFSPAEIEVWRKRGRIEVENTRTHQMLPMDYEIVQDALENVDRFDIKAAVTELDKPWLLIHGTADETVPVSEGEELAALSRDGRFESRFIAGAGHTFGSRHPWAGPNPETEELFGATVKFLSQHLP